jgi:hypothetical protein
MMNIEDIAKQWVNNQYGPFERLTKDLRDSFYRDLGILSDFSRALPDMLKERGITKVVGVPVTWTNDNNPIRTTRLLDGALALLHEHGIRCDAKDLEAARLRQSMGVPETQKPKS